MPVQTKDKAEAAKKAAAATPAPKDFDPAQIAENDLPEFMDVPEGIDEAAEKAKNGIEKKYEPSARTIEALNKLPKAELKAELGLDIDRLITSQKQYGVLEPLAYGSFTTQPVYIIPRRAEHQKFSRGGFWASIRVGAWSDKNGELKWNYEIHPVKFMKKYVRDEAGELVKKANGEYRTEVVIDRNPISPDEVLNLDGKPLSPEQMDQIRLTGQLCEPFSSIGFDHKPINELIDCNPLNRHEFIRKNASVVAERLKRNPEFKHKGQTYKLTDRQIDAIVMRKGVWLGEKSNAVFVQYNCAYDKLTPAINFEKAKKMEMEKAKTVSKGEAQGEAETMSKGAGRHM